MQLRSLTSYLCLVGVDVAVLASLRPQPRGIVRDLAAPHAWVNAVGADAAAATLAEVALWFAAVWLAVGLLAGLLVAAPGAAGALAAGLARALLPQVLYRLAVGATGAGLVLAPTAGGAVLAIGGLAVAAEPTQSAVPPMPTPGWPTTAPESTVPHSSPRPPRPPRPPASPAVVTVRPGDSLWKIAAARLGHPNNDNTIASSWRRIYQTNRAVIGPDPGLIRPGQQLRVDQQPQS